MGKKSKKKVQWRRLSLNNSPVQQYQECTNCTPENFYKTSRSPSPNCDAELSRDCREVLNSNSQRLSYLNERRFFNCPDPKGYERRNSADRDRLQKPYQKFTRSISHDQYRDGAPHSGDKRKPHFRVHPTKGYFKGGFPHHGGIKRRWSEEEASHTGEYVEVDVEVYDENSNPDCPFQPVHTVLVGNEEYTKIQTPRQEVMFRKSFFDRKKDSEDDFSVTSAPGGDLGSMPDSVEDSLSPSEDMNPSEFQAESSYYEDPGYMFAGDPSKPPLAGVVMQQAYPGGPMIPIPVQWAPFIDSNLIPGDTALTTLNPMFTHVVDPNSIPDSSYLVPVQHDANGCPVTVQVKLDANGAPVEIQPSSFQVSLRTLNPSLQQSIFPPGVQPVSTMVCQEQTPCLTNQEPSDSVTDVDINGNKSSEPDPKGAPLISSVSPDDTEKQEPKDTEDSSSDSQYASMSEASTTPTTPAGELSFPQETTTEAESSETKSSGDLSQNDSCNSKDEVFEESKQPILLRGDSAICSETSEMETEVFSSEEFSHPPSKETVSDDELPSRVTQTDEINGDHYSNTSGETETVCQTDDSFHKKNLVENDGPLPDLKSSTDSTLDDSEQSNVEELTEDQFYNPEENEQNESETKNINDEAKSFEDSIVLPSFNGHGEEPKVIHSNEDLGKTDGPAGSVTLTSVPEEPENILCHDKSFTAETEDSPSVEIEEKEKESSTNISEGDDETKRESCDDSALVDSEENKFLDSSSSEDCSDDLSQSPPPTESTEASESEKEAETTDTKSEQDGLSTETKPLPDDDKIASYTEGTKKDTKEAKDSESGEIQSGFIAVPILTPYYDPAVLYGYPLVMQNQNQRRHTDKSPSKTKRKKFRRHSENRQSTLFLDTELYTGEPYISTSNGYLVPLESQHCQIHGYQLPNGTFSSIVPPGGIIPFVPQQYDGDEGPHQNQYSPKKTQTTVPNAHTKKNLPTTRLEKTDSNDLSDSGVSESEEHIAKDTSPIEVPTVSRDSAQESCQTPQDEEILQSCESLVENNIQSDDSCPEKVRIPSESSALSLGSSSEDHAKSSSSDDSSTISTPPDNPSTPKASASSKTCKTKSKPLAKPPKWEKVRNSNKSTSKNEKERSRKEPNSTASALLEPKSRITLVNKEGAIYRINKKRQNSPKSSIAELDTFEPITESIIPLEMITSTSSAYLGEKQQNQDQDSNNLMQDSSNSVIVEKSSQLADSKKSKERQRMNSNHGEGEEKSRSNKSEKPKSKLNSQSNLKKNLKSSIDAQVDSISKDNTTTNPTETEVLNQTQDEPTPEVQKTPINLRKSKPTLKKPKNPKIKSDAIPVLEENLFKVEDIQKIQEQLFPLLAKENVFLPKTSHPLSRNLNQFSPFLYAEEASYNQITNSKIFISPHLEKELYSSKRDSKRKKKDSISNFDLSEYSEPEISTLTSSPLGFGSINLDLLESRTSSSQRSSREESVDSEKCSCNDVEPTKGTKQGKKQNKSRSKKNKKDIENKDVKFVQAKSQVTQSSSSKKKKNRSLSSTPTSSSNKADKNQPRRQLTTKTSISPNPETEKVSDDLSSTPKTSKPRKERGRKPLKLQCPGPVQSDDSATNSKYTPDVRDEDSLPESKLLADVQSESSEDSSDVNCEDSLPYQASADVKSEDTIPERPERELSTGDKEEDNPQDSVSSTHINDEDSEPQSGMSPGLQQEDISTEEKSLSLEVDLEDVSLSLCIETIQDSSLDNENFVPSDEPERIEDLDIQATDITLEVKVEQVVTEHSEDTNQSSEDSLNTIDSFKNEDNSCETESSNVLEVEELPGAEEELVEEVSVEIGTKPNNDDSVGDSICSSHGPESSKMEPLQNLGVTEAVKRWIREVTPEKAFILPEGIQDPLLSDVESEDEFFDDNLDEQETLQQLPKNVICNPTAASPSEEGQGEGGNRVAKKSKGFVFQALDDTDKVSLSSIVSRGQLYSESSLYSLPVSEELSFDEEDNEDSLRDLAKYDPSTYSKYYQLGVGVDSPTPAASSRASSNDRDSTITYTSEELEVEKLRTLPQQSSSSYSMSLATELFKVEKAKSNMSHISEAVAKEDLDLPMPLCGAVSDGTLTPPSSSGIGSSLASTPTTSPLHKLNVEDSMSNSPLRNIKNTPLPCKTVCCSLM